jgi:hypothetical protein
MKKFAGFSAVTIAISCIGAWLITLAVPGQDVARSVWASALTVVMVQAVAFSLARTMQPVNVIAGWGMGMLLRFIALVIYGFVGVKLLGLAMEPALLSLAGFFFVSTVIEPIFLKP